MGVPDKFPRQMDHDGIVEVAEPESVHWVKSISFPQDLQVCFLSNSSEKISSSFEQEGQLQENDFKFLNS